MSSRKPDQQNDLDSLIRDTLDAHTGSAEPSRSVWQTIEKDLVEKHYATPRRTPVVIGNTLVQVALVVAVLILGNFYLEGLFTPAVPDNPTPDAPVSLQKPALKRYFDEYSSPPTGADLYADQAELRRLKVQNKLSQAPIVPDSAPVAVLPFDVMPHPMSPEGRLLNARQSSTADQTRSADDPFAVALNPRLIR